MEPAMTKRSILPALVVLMLPLPAKAQSNPLVQSLMGLYGTTEQYIMATATDLDADMYAFQPTDEVRTAGRILAHIADSQFIFCSAAAGASNPHSGSFEETATTKDAVVSALEQGFEYCHEVYAGTTDMNASTAVAFFTGPNTRGGVLAFNSAHNYEHYGNLVTYMRLNGIVPPSSR
jgi:uncharacterized damage-inducible protein DinB